MKRNDPRHGTPAGYGQHRKEGKQPCRPCVVAKREYDKAWRERTDDAAKQRKRHAAKPRPCRVCGAQRHVGQRMYCDDCRHGRANTYSNGCRCDACFDAYTEQRRGQRKADPEGDRRRAESYRKKVREALALVRKLEAEGVL